MERLVAGCRGGLKTVLPVFGGISRHGRACPGHPDRKSAAFHAVGITGTGPVTTRKF
jgi:hypothetical protein